MISSIFQSTRFLKHTQYKWSNENNFVQLKTKYIHFSRLDINDFFLQRRCREIGGFLVKIDDSAENKWVKENLVKKGKF